MKVSAALQLVRISALPSALADVFGGMALAYALLGHSFLSSKVLLLIPASIGVYLGGMALNDLLHVRKDGLLRKKRPIVTGEISLKAAKAITFALLIGGFACGLLAGAAIWYGLLVLLIVVYDMLAAGRIRGVTVVNPLPQAAAGVSVIALCRALHVSIPLLAHSHFEALSAEPLWLLFAGSVFVYFCLITVVSLFEDLGGGKQAVRLVSWLLYPAVLALPLWVLLVPAEPTRPLLEYLLPVLLAAGLLIHLQSRLDKARSDPTPANLGRSVGAGIRGEAMLMAAFALLVAPDQWWWGLLALACYPLGAILSRWISPT